MANMQDIVFNSLPTIQTLLGESSTVGVVIGENQTLDTVAAGLSLYLALKDSGKSVQIISKKDPIVEYSNLVAIDQIARDFSGVTRTFTISVPYRNEEIEKVSYNIEGDRLSVNLFAEEKGISFTEKDIEYIKKGSAPSLIITIGVEDLSQLQIEQGVKIINIDNSGFNSMFGDVPLVDSAFSSTSELVTRLIEELRLPLDIDTAQNLLDGITNATQNFTSPKTSATAFTAAGVLLSKGARRTEVRNSPNVNQNLSQLVRNNPPQNQNSRRDRRGRDRGIRPQNQNRPYSQMPRQFQNPQPSTQTNPSPFQEDIAPMQEEPEQIQMPHTPRSTGSIPAPVIDDNDMVDRDFVDQPDDQAPSDWFIPKVFKSTKPQE